MLKNRYFYLTKKGIVDKTLNKWVYGNGVYEPPSSTNNQESQQKKSDESEDFSNSN